MNMSSTAFSCLSPPSVEHEGTSRTAGARSDKGSGRGYEIDVEGRACGENIKIFFSYHLKHL